MVTIDDQNPVSPDGHYRWDGHSWQHIQVALLCQTCGAGLMSSSASTSVRCGACGSQAEMRRCPACSVTVHVPSGLRGQRVRCMSCGASFGWTRWQAGPVTAGEAARSYPLPPEELADQSRRIVGGIVIAAAGLPPLAQGVGCKLEFTQRCVLLYARIAGGGYEIRTTLEYSEIEFLGVGGAGAQSTTTGGGWVGGGFGLVGMASGILFATAMNALTERTHTWVETVVHLRATGARELVLEHSVMSPTSLQVSLAPVFERLNAAEVTASSTPSEADPLARLERLVELHRSGALSDDEFEQTKRRMLDEI